MTARQELRGLAGGPIAVAPPIQEDVSRNEAVLLQISLCEEALTTAREALKQGDVTTAMDQLLEVELYATRAARQLEGQPSGI